LFLKWKEIPFRGQVRQRGDRAKNRERFHHSPFGAGAYYRGFVIFTLSKSKPVPRLYSLCAPKSVTSGRMKFCAAKNFPLPGTCEVLACGAAHACCRFVLDTFIDGNSRTGLPSCLHRMPRVWTLLANLCGPCG